MHNKNQQLLPGMKLLDGEIIENTAQRVAWSPHSSSTFQTSKGRFSFRLNLTIGLIPYTKDAPERSLQDAYIVDGPKDFELIAGNGASVRCHAGLLKRKNMKT